MERADLVPGEQVHVLNINNGSRFITYVIEAAAGTKAVVLNGAAARLASVGRYERDKPRVANRPQLESYAEWWLRGFRRLF